MNRDSKGLIVQPNGDGGDTPQREGSWTFGNCLRMKSSEGFTPLDLEKAIDQLQVYPGVFIRNPFKWTDTKDFSRDQHNPLVMAMGCWCYYRPVLNNTFRNHVKRFGRYQNADWMGPHDLGMYIRALRVWYAWPYLLFSDWFLVLGSLINIVKSFDRTYSDDAPNWTMMLVQAKHFLPTPVSWLARKLYYKLRRRTAVPPYFMNNSVSVGCLSNPVVRAMYFYHDPAFNGIIELAQLWEPIILEG